MNLYDKIAEQQLLSILSQLRENNIENDQAIQSQLIFHFQQLEENDKNKFIQHLNEQYSDQPQQQQKIFSFLLKPQQEEECLIELIRQGNWKRIIQQFQNEEFRKKNQVPSFWGSQQAVHLIISNYEILSNVCRLTQSNDQNKGYSYLSSLSLWFELLSTELCKNSSNRLILEQIIGSSLKKQIWHYLEYQEYLKNFKREEYNKLILMIRTFQTQKQTKIDISSLDVSTQLLFNLKANLVDQEYFENYLKKVFCLQDQQIDFYKLSKNLNQLILKKSNLEEIYFISTFYFLIQYCNIFSFKNIYENTFTQKWSQNGPVIDQFQLEQGIANQNDYIYQFLIVELIYFSEHTKLFKNNYLQFIYQQYFESKITKLWEQKIEIYQLNYNQFLQIIQLLRMIPLIKLQNNFQNAKSLDLIKLIFELLAFENSLIIYDIIQNTKNLNIYQSTQFIIQKAHQLQNTESTVYLLQLVCLIYNHSEKYMKYFIKILYLKNQNFKGQLTLDILTIVDEHKLDVKRIKHIFEELQQCVKSDWQEIKYILSEIMIHQLFQVIFQLYQNEQYGFEQQKIVYQILHLIGENITCQSESDQGVFFFWENKVHKTYLTQLFWVISRKCDKVTTQKLNLRLFSFLSTSKNKMKETKLYYNFIEQIIIKNFNWKFFYHYLIKDRAQMIFMGNQTFFYNFTKISKKYTEIFRPLNYFDDQSLCSESLSNFKIKQEFVNLGSQPKSQEQIRQDSQINQSGTQLTQNSSSESENNIESEKLYKQLEYIFEDIKDGILTNETEILGEITPIFNELNQRYQEKCKILLHNEFKEFSFVQNQLFSIKSINKRDQLCFQTSETFYNLKIKRDWKKLLSQFKEDSFCAENQIPQFWRTKECVRVFSAHESVLENVLNLKELNEAQQNYNYIDILQILLVVLCYSKDNKQDRQIIEQIVGSVLNLQMLQFAEYQQNLQKINQSIFNKMIDQIQLYQLKQIDNIQLIDCDYRFQTFIKVIISEYNHQEIECYLENFFQSKIVSISKKHWEQKIQDVILRRNNLEEPYFMLTFYYYTQYCQIYHLQTEKISIDENLQKQKKDKDRQISYLTRNCKKKIAENNGDMILQFLINFICYFQETSQQFKERFNQFQSAQLIQGDQLEKLQNMSFKNILECPEKQHILIQGCGQVSLIKTSQFFPQELDMWVKFLVIHQLRKLGEKIVNDIFFYACRQSRKSTLQCLQFIESFCEKFNSQELTVYCFILVSEIYNLYEQNLADLIQLFRIDNALDKLDYIIYLNQMIDNCQIEVQSLNLNEIIGKFCKLTLKDWFIIKFTLGYQVIEFLYHSLTKDYLKIQMNSDMKNNLYEILVKLGVLISKISGPYIWSSKLLFILLPKKTLNYFINHIQLPKMKSEVIFKQIFCILFQLLQRIEYSQKLQMLDFFHEAFDASSIKFLVLKDQVKNNISSNLMYQYFLLNYYHQIQAKELLLKGAQSFYCSNQQTYIQLFQSSNYFNVFKLNPQYLKMYQIQQQYPFESEITLEDFNISLQEMSQEKLEQIIKEWFQCLNDSKKFRQLIPVYFNLIKRKEQSKNVLSIINNLQAGNNPGINMKALFQILYNNSNNELKSMLLKLWSTSNPVPLIYSNPNIQSSKVDVIVEEDLYCLNEKLNYIFPDCLPIISFSLSRKQTSYGKTSLINQIFYSKEVFEVSDNYRLNQNTIDIMFDFCFSGSRQLAIADAHGIIPINVLLKILPLFQVWIIQMDSEIELKENIQQLLELQQKIQIPECCLIIRNSTLQTDLILEDLNISNVTIHQIIDLTQKGLDKQAINSAKESFQKFIFEKIQKVEKLRTCQQKEVKNFLICQEFQKILSSYYGNNYYEIKNMSERQKIYEQLNRELEKFVKQPDGFLSQNAFPIRSLMLKIKQHKSEQYQLDGLNKVEKENKIQQKQNEIEKLENQIPQQKSTLLLDIFQKIFLLPEYYMVYLQFTDQIRIFNDQHTKKLQDQIQEKNEDIQRKKLEKKKRKVQYNLQKYQEIKDSEELKKLKLELENKKNQLGQINIGIELFWRELTQIKQKCFSHQLKINPTEIVASLIRKGENFEFLDGDSFSIDQQFLSDIVKLVADSENEKVLVLSILGPQSSGKSTILNKIFGCHFWTSVGRCTKGIYLQLLKITKKQDFSQYFDYVLILDTEGLQNPNQSDNEFDKKIALYILSISDIILINVEGDINSQFKNLVEMCIYTLGLMKNTISSSKQLSWCFNQNND